MRDQQLRMELAGGAGLAHAKLWAGSLAPHEPGVVTYTGDTSTWEAEPRGLPQIKS